MWDTQTKIKRDKEASVKSILLQDIAKIKDIDISLFLVEGHNAIRVAEHNDVQYAPLRRV